jgi:hypothetical protein
MIMKLKLLILLSLLLIFTEVYSQSPVVQQILNSSRQDSLIHFVRELSGNVPTIINGTSQTILSRHKLQPGNALAETYIKQKLESYGLLTTIQSFSATGKNVYAVQPGTEFPNQKYIICAHFDDMPSGTTAPGADDNASGTAAVIEAARIFSQYSFPFTIIYALWDEEEQGLVGSDYYAAQAASAGDSILGVINLDMIAYDSNNDGIVNIHSRPTAGNSVEIKDKLVECNSLYGINLNIVVKSPGSTYSDHASFWSRNYGAVLIIEDENDFHPYYHTVNDHIQYFNQAYFFKSAKLGFAALASFALNLNLNLNHTPIASTSTSTNIQTDVFISTGIDIGTGNLSPRLYYRTKTIGGVFGQFNSVLGSPIESGNYTFEIPAQPLGSTVQYYIAVQDANSTLIKTLPVGGSGYNPPGNIPPSNFFQFFVASQSIALYDEAVNINNWTASGGWNVTTAKYVSPPTSFTDSPGGNYSNNTTAVFRYNNQINLNGIIGASLEYDAQWNIENNYDYAQVQISTNNGSTWTALAGSYTNPGTGTFQPNGEPLYDGIQSTWVHEIIDISNYVNQNISLRFQLRTDGSITADGIYIDNIKITKFTTSFQASVAYENGWNLVSIPGLHPVDQNVNTWWQERDPLANVFYYSNGYQSVINAAPNKGYWMKHLGSNTYNTGDEWPESGLLLVPHNPIAVSAGWNFISGFEKSVLTSNVTTIPPGLQIGQIYGYLPNSGYYVASYLDPGYGYCINLSGSGSIVIPEVLDNVPIKKSATNNDLGKIVLTDAAGKSYTLYSVSGEVDLNQYELPPLPPAGMFDVRYTSGRYAEEISSSAQTVEMSGVEYPVTVRVEGMAIRVQDESGKVVNTLLKSGEEVVISNPMVGKLKVSSNVIPEVYALEQNYPNPFNPATTIEFSIPEDVENVKLTIYDALGQKVVELVNGKLEAGRYSYQWDASRVATGLYIYQLSSEKFTSTKKMMLMK